MDEDGSGVLKSGCNEKRGTIMVSCSRDAVSWGFTGYTELHIVGRHSVQSSYRMYKDV
jgi:hypothetical protein